MSNGSSPSTRDREDDGFRVKSRSKTAPSGPAAGARGAGRPRAGGSRAQESAFITELYGRNLAVLIAAIATVTLLLLAQFLGWQRATLSRHAGMPGSRCSASAQPLTS